MDCSAADVVDFEVVTQYVVTLGARNCISAPVGLSARKSLNVPEVGTAFTFQATKAQQPIHKILTLHYIFLSVAISFIPPEHCALPSVTSPSIKVASFLCLFAAQTHQHGKRRV